MATIAEEVYNFISEYHINVVYRRFLRDQPSQFYDPVRKEGVGGPTYNYIDEKCYARVQRAFRASASQGVDLYDIQGIISDDYYVFYLPYGNFEYALRTEPQTQDELYIVSDFDNYQNEIASGTAKRYRIIRVIPNYEYDVPSYYTIIAIREDRKY